jgi:hypothetical protein
MTEPSQHPGTLYVAVVHAIDGIRVAAGADSRVELVGVLAEYIQQRVSGALRADEVQHLRGLLARGELEAAVEVYFGLVGRPALGFSSPSHNYTGQYPVRGDLVTCRAHCAFSAQSDVRALFLSVARTRAGPARPRGLSH